MLAVLLFCFSSLARSDQRICSTQEDVGVFSTSSTSGSGQSLLQAKISMQGTTSNLSFAEEDSFSRPSDQDRRKRRRRAEKQRPTRNASLAQLASERASRQGEHATKYATSPYGEALLQKDMDGTLQKKYKGNPVQDARDVKKDFDETLKEKRSQKHIPEKCLTRKSSWSNYFSLGQSCCAATTQVAACLDGYLVHWSERKCALGADGNGDANGWLGGSLVDGGMFADSVASGGARAFECLPSKVDENGRRKAGMPGTEHRRRWRYDEDGAEGKTGSCCGIRSCNSCEENFAIRSDKVQCGLGELWLCASQHR